MAWAATPSTTTAASTRPVRWVLPPVNSIRPPPSAVTADSGPRCVVDEGKRSVAPSATSNEPADGRPGMLPASIEKVPLRTSIVPSFAIA